jgi:hypothetical protein
MEQTLQSMVVRAGSMAMVGLACAQMAQPLVLVLVEVGWIADTVPTKNILAEQVHLF